jgi:hypothetical protein
MKNSFILKYPHHFSQIECNIKNCSTEEYPKRYSHIKEAEEDGWEFMTHPNMFKNYWICPICSKNKEERI